MCDREWLVTGGDRVYLQTFQNVLLQKPGLSSLGLPALTFLRSAYFQGSKLPAPGLTQRG